MSVNPASATPLLGRRHMIGLALGAAAAGAATGVATAAAPAKAGRAAKAASAMPAVDALADALVAERVLPGMSLAVMRAGSLVHAKGYGRSNLETVARGPESHVHVQPAVARGLDEADHTEVVEQPLGLGGGLLRHRERGARPGVEVDAQLVARVAVCGPHRPRVEAEAAEVHRPDEVREVGDD